MTNPLMMVNISAMSYQNPSRNGKAMDRTQKKHLFLTFDLKVTDLGLELDTSSHDGQHFCQDIKIHQGMA